MIQTKLTYRVLGMIVIAASINLSACKVDDRNDPEETTVVTHEEHGHTATHENLTEIHDSGAVVMPHADSSAMLEQKVNMHTDTIKVHEVKK